MKKLYASAFLLITGIALMNACKKPGAASDVFADLHARGMAAMLSSTPFELRQVYNLAGNGTTTLFNAAAGTAVDASGNVYVADANNNRIQKITPTGDMSTLAGSTSSGLINANGAAARFNHPTGVALDVSGNVYVADSLNNVIRRITPAGDVTTYAGTSEPGYTEGPASTAKFAGPSAVAIDAAGIVYIADAGNQRIRKITTDEQVMLIAGDGNAGYSDLPGRFAEFNTPAGIAVTTTGSFIYVADKNNHAIRKISAAGAVSTLAGNGSPGTADGIGDAASFTFPAAVAIDTTGTVYVADRGNNRIRQITTVGSVSTLAGSVAGFVEGSLTAARFDAPAGIAVDANGLVYVSDQNNRRIREITILVKTIAGDGTFGFLNGPGNTAQFYVPPGVAVDHSRNVYVADQWNHRIRKIAPNGNVTTLAGQATPGFTNGLGGAAQFNYPVGIAVDGAGNVYVADGGNHSIRKVTPAGAVTTVAGTGIAGFKDGVANQAQFNNPSAVAVDADGNIYVADQLNNRIRKISTNGIVGPAFGTNGSTFTDENGVLQGVSNPLGIAVDNNKNIYFTTRDDGTGCKCNNHVFKVTQAGVASLMAGDGLRGFTDGPGLTARLNNPGGVAVDANGTLYVGDLYNHRIRKITPDRVVSTMAGNATATSMGDFLDGPAKIAKFNFPWGVAVDDSGYVYVADFYSNRIRKIY